MEWKELLFKRSRQQRKKVPHCFYGTNLLCYFLSCRTNWRDSLLLLLVVVLLLLLLLLLLLRLIIDFSDTPIFRSLVVAQKFQKSQKCFFFKIEFRFFIFPLTGITKLY